MNMCICEKRQRKNRSWSSVNYLSGSRIQINKYSKQPEEKVKANSECEVGAGGK